jgi:cytoskeletal protein RodZ
MKLFWQKEKIDIDFEQQRQAKLTELGLCLQEFRERRQLSLEVISNQIHIPIRLLKALEKAKLEELPEPVYTRELLRKYANYLGLKGDNFAQNFNIKIDEKKKKKLKFTWGIYQLEIKPIYFYISYIILMALSVRTLGDFIQKYPLTVNSVPKIQTNKIPNHHNLSTSTKAGPSYPSKPVGEKAEKPSTKPEKLIVKITVQDQCWLRVTVDGKTEFQGVLTKGTQRQWIAKQQLTIRAGNAGGLLVAFNEEQAKQLGKLGQVEEITFELPRSSLVSLTDDKPHPP